MSEKKIEKESRELTWRHWRGPPFLGLAQPTRSVVVFYPPPLQAARWSRERDDDATTMPRLLGLPLPSLSRHARLGSSQFLSPPGTLFPLSSVRSREEP